MIGNSPSAHALTTRTPTGKARRALFVGVPLQQPDSPADASLDNMAKADAMRHIPVATPVSSVQRASRGDVVGEADPEFVRRVSKVAEKFSESLVVLGNEPSLGLYRLQEHVRRSVPILVDYKRELSQVNLRVQGVCFDTDYAGSVVRKMHRIPQFSNVQELLNKAISLKQELNKQEAVVRSSPSVKRPVGAAASDSSPSLRHSAESKPAQAPSAAAQPSPLGLDSGPAKLLPGLSAEGALKAAQQKKQPGDLDLTPRQF